MGTLTHPRVGSAIDMPRSFACRFATLALVGIVAAGCIAPVRQPSVPPEISTAKLRDIDAPAGSAPKADTDVLAVLPKMIGRGQGDERVATRSPQNYLALSGGGVFGAYSVGLLNGWTNSGTRPHFDVVTGISTGALIATYAFLGPRYDERLRNDYSEFGSDKVYKGRRKVSLLWSDSAVTSEPLEKRIEAAVTDDVLAEVAAAHAAGRRLYIGTTNLDTRKLVIWDMGAIASSGRPEARQLYRQVLLASASVPGFFPPVLIDVEIDGRKYQEMHVDGGTNTSVFFQPYMLNLDPNDIRSRVGSNLYVILAGKIFDDPHSVEPSILNIAGTGLRTMLYAGARSDLGRLYTLAEVTGVNFHLASTAQDFPINTDSLTIDTKEMRRLYDEGYRQGLNGGEWNSRLSYAGLGEEIMPRTGTHFEVVK
jgi:predicted acylesterase/phospholipase RssA